MAKKVILGPKPQQNQGVKKANADEWVNGSLRQDDSPSGAGLGQMPPDAPAMKRLTIDVPETLHTQIKSRCALKGVKMADEIRALLEGHFLA